MSDDHVWEGMTAWEQFYNPAYEIDGIAYSEMGLPVNHGFQFCSDRDALIMHALKVSKRKKNRLLWILFKARKLT